jgi:membrane-associated tyrosine/threonine-specific cdc2-inhibitory kinase
MPLDLNMDLARPYDQRRINSFQSSLSSNTQMNVSGCDELGTISTPGRTGGDAERPSTPREVQLHFQLHTAQCSPIPGIPEEDVDATGSSVMDIDDVLRRSSKAAQQGGSKNADEASVASESTNAKMRRLRPMPDMSAFESIAVLSSHGNRSLDDSATMESRANSASPRLLCPPTPVRTPAWANEGGGHHAFFHRQNSLITTKVLLTCPSQVLEGRTSLESSIMDDDSKASGRVFRRTSNGSKTERMGDAEMNTNTMMGVLGSNNNSVSAAERNSNSVAGLTLKTPQMRLPPPPRLLPRFASEREVGTIISFSTDFETLGVLGSGAFADVYKVRSKRDNRLYAVKRNRRQFRGKRDRDMAMSEVRSMQRLQSICAETGESAPSSNEKKSHSLYLLFFFRAWQEDGYFLCQTELCCRDTCREMLDSLRVEWNSAKAKYPSLLCNLPGPDGIAPGSDLDLNGRRVPNATLWKICHDIAAGLSHIHENGLVHHDIKPSNIFFVSCTRFGAMCKIGDFGMAGDIGTTGDGQEGDTRYMPLELLSLGSRQPSSDIFSLGLTLYELASDISGELPSEGLRWHELRSDRAPQLPSCRDNELVELIKLMTSPSDTKRPTADTILKNEKVISAGQGCDHFLRDYVRDIDEYDRLEDERLAMDHQEDQTPQNANRSTIRSPSFAMLIPQAPNLLLSPPAAPSRPNH